MAYVVQALRSAHRAASPPMPLALLQPALKRIVRHVARQRPQVFERLGPHRAARFVIDPVDLPFVLYLEPNPRAPLMRACARGAVPAHDARNAARFARLMRMIETDQDGDAMFFARDLAVSGDTEAVVSLRNAIDNLDHKLADLAASAYGPPGRIVLALMRRALNRNARP
jgi:predicted lipid carrier protein YhbT